VVGKSTWDNKIRCLVDNVIVCCLLFGGWKGS
jgi:hypothetical protein